jgi:hypothetical protein
LEPSFPNFSEAGTAYRQELSDLVDDKVELGGLLDRPVGGFFAL